MTAKEYLQKEYNTSSQAEYAAIRTNLCTQEIDLIRFARYHVQKALEAASKVDLAWEPNYMDETGEGFYSTDVKGILNSYPPENIK